ncbi:hypothetical protein FVE85_1407 [Porphyridium purpureum]|uniref:Uncharacterized protein n=1 Tax=Porphyridium purpureum TaxID=35688 RepID=A0A5J4YWM3_PORPP|nr:hypothetical protein FVE85_1407 [Porphyridium purpureum]|eukprot:POR8109..scf209_3
MHTYTKMGVRDEAAHNAELQDDAREFFCDMLARKGPKIEDSDAFTESEALSVAAHFALMFVEGPLRLQSAAMARREADRETHLIQRAILFSWWAMETWTLDTGHGPHKPATKEFLTFLQGLEVCCAYAGTHDHQALPVLLDRDCGQLGCA